MNIGFKGSYVFNINLQTMFLNETIQIKGNNIITLLGESFFLNRAINDTFSPIQYICLGNSKNRPQKSDLKLGNEILKRKCSKRVDLDNKQIICFKSIFCKELFKTIHGLQIQNSHKKIGKCINSNNTKIKNRSINNRCLKYEYS